MFLFYGLDIENTYTFCQYRGWRDYHEQHAAKTDVILIGAGIMSATLGSLLKELAPEWEIKVLKNSQVPGKKALTNGIMQVQGILRYAN